MRQKDKDFNLQEIEEIIRGLGKLMKEVGLVEVEAKDGSKRIFLKREVPIRGSTVSPIAQPKTEVKGSEGELVVIKPPTPGTFYGRANPDSEPYVKIGSKVEPQTTVCIIEAMKVMNQIAAGITGTIVEIGAKDGQAVGCDTLLFKVKPD